MEPCSPDIDQHDLRFLIEKNADGIIVVNDAGVVLFANPAAERVFGRPARALLGSAMGIPLVADEMTEITIHHPDARSIEAEIRVVDTTWNNRPAKIASIRDISSRRAMEDRLRHAAKMEAIGRLTAGVAHDFNNLLTVVLGNLEGATRRIEASSPELSDRLDNAHRAARQAALLTGKLLVFSRRKPLEFQVVDPGVLIAGMSQLLRRTLGEKIAIQTLLPPDLWLVEVDSSELESAILNLAVNSRDAMPDGGELTIQAANVRRRPEDPAEGNGTEGPHVLISVSDTGMGMKPGIVAQVFEPFFTTKAEGSGTGLGLSQVYGFVKQSGGGIKLTSAPDQGTRVEMFLPRARAGAQPAPLREAPNAGPMSRGQLHETILVVEDDDAVRELSASLLREFGYRVLESANAESALRILAEEPEVALLFTDLGLPGKDNGKALAAKSRRLRPGLKVLITTAYASDALFRDGRLEPGFKLLSKPFTAAELANRVRQALDEATAANIGSRILVVEDEPLVRLLISEMVADGGYDVLEAATFNEGLAKAEDPASDVSAAIIDLGLPDGAGDELVLKLRALRPALPMVLTSGHPDEELRQRLKKLTRFAILAKPFTAAQLALALASAGL